MNKYKCDYLNKCNINNIDIWELQKSLTEKQLVKIDFAGNVIFVVAKNEVYLDHWNPCCFPIGFLKIWSYKMFDEGNYESFDYIQLCNKYIEDENYWCKILIRLVEKCNFTFENKKFNKTRKEIIEDLKQYL